VQLFLNGFVSCGCLCIKKMGLKDYKIEKKIPSFSENKNVRM
jgi:hypothetical protein